MECFGKIVKGWNSLTIFVKDFILDVWQRSECASELNRLNLYLHRLVQLNESVFKQNCRLGPRNFIKMIFYK